MKARFLRRVFCVVMCVVVLACSSVNAFGAELYSDQYPMRWNNYSGGQVYIYWSDYNCATANSALANNLAAGVGYWDALNKVTATYSSTEYDGSITFSVPSESWWQGVFDNNYLVYSHAAGLAVVYDTAYLNVTENNVSLSNLSILLSLIYFNPIPEYYSLNNFDTYNYRCLIAHEIGHALGFGHIVGVNSIMNQGSKSFYSLQQIDLSCFNSKYTEG